MLIIALNILVQFILLIFLMFGRQPRLPIDLEMGLPIDVLGDSWSKTRYVHKLKQRLKFAYKKAKEMSRKRHKSTSCLMIKGLKDLSCKLMILF